MKFTFPILLALATAAPVFSSELEQTLTMTIVSDWDEGLIRNIDLATLPDDKIVVDGQPIQRVQEIPGIIQTDVLYRIKVEREKLWKDFYYVCQAKVAKDPKVPDVHIFIGGEGEDIEIRANQHEDEIITSCEKTDV